MKRTIPFHPFLFSLYPALALLAGNVFAFSISTRVVFSVMLLSLGLSALIWGILWVILRDIQRSAIVALVALLFFFSYGHLYNALDGLKIIGFYIGRHRFLLPLVTLSFGLLTYLMLKIQRNAFKQITKICNVTALILLLMPVSQMGYRAMKVENQQHKFVSNQLNIQIPKDLPDSLPNIYYIIVDRYPGVEGLKLSMGYDNQWFIDSLKARGFIVPEHSYSNYSSSHLSLAATLNGNYMSTLGFSKNDVVNNIIVIEHAIKDNSFMRLFKACGYNIIHVGSWWNPTYNNPQADINIQEGLLDEFSLIFIRTTVLAVFDNHIIAADLRKLIDGSFSKLTNDYSFGKPYFIFAHIICPHGPYVFNAEGRPLPIVFNQYYTTRCLAQLEYANKMILRTVDKINNGKNVIIIQSDHGFNIFADGSTLDKSKNNLEITYGIFNAWYLPANSYGIQIPKTSVNTLRFVADRYLKTNLGSLPNRSIYYDDKTGDSLDVTDSLDIR